MKIFKRDFKVFIEYGYCDGGHFITHREDGPAIIYSVGEQFWYAHGKCITEPVRNWLKDHDLTFDTMNDNDKEALKFFMMVNHYV